MPNPLKKILSKLLPAQLKRFLKYLLRTPQRVTVYKQRAKGKATTKADIISGLRSMGIKKGDTIFVHSSLRAFGYLEGGAQALIDALLETVGKDGNVCMPSFGPLPDGKTFDVRSTPSGVGKVSDVFWRMPNAKRSLSPTHSVACIGKNADHITKGCLLDQTPFTKNSPYYKMMQLGAKVIALGSPFRRSLTCNYIIEDLLGAKFPVKVYEGQPREFVVIDAAGKRHKVKKRVHDLSIDPRRVDYNPGIAQWLEGILIKSKCMQKGSIGQAEVRIYGIRCLIDELRSLLKQGKTIYAPAQEKQ